MKIILTHWNHVHPSSVAYGSLVKNYDLAYVLSFFSFQEKNQWKSDMGFCVILRINKT